jgi:hypothetical protein
LSSSKMVLTKFSDMVNVWCNFQNTSVRHRFNSTTTWHCQQHSLNNPQWVSF